MGKREQWSTHLVRNGVTGVRTVEIRCNGVRKSVYNGFSFSNVFGIPDNVLQRAKTVYEEATAHKPKE